jgi:hypothetical protein
LAASSGSKNAIGSPTWMRIGRPESTGRRPERIEAGIVDRDEASLRVARTQSEQLPDLQPSCAGVRRRAIPSGFSFAELVVDGEPVVVDAANTTTRSRRVRSGRSRLAGACPSRRRGRRSLRDATASSTSRSSSTGPLEPASAERCRAEVRMCVDDRERGPLDGVTGRLSIERGA